MSKKEIKYPASAFAKDLDFVEYQDLISIIAEPDKLYSKDEMKKLIQQYCEREVAVC